MFIGSLKIKLEAPWVHSLKEKRMVVKSIIGKTRNKFNISIHEVEAMDVHQTIIIGISVVSNSRVEADSMLSKVIAFIEENTEATILDSELEIF